MSSYRSSNYVQWRSSSGLGNSSYSPASSTSSLASSTSTGGSSSKYSSSMSTSSNLKPSETTGRSPSSRENSFVSGLSGTATTGGVSGRLNASRFSTSLSSKSDNATSGSSSNYGSSNLSSTTKSTFSSSSSPSSISKDKATNSYVLPSVSSLSSKFSSSTEPSTSSNNASSYRTSSSSSSYLRTGATSESNSSSKSNNAKTSADSNSSQSTGKYSMDTSSSIKSNDMTSNNSIGSSSVSSNISTSSPNYRSYASRGIGGSTDLTLGSSSVASALRTTARFGLRSGPAHAHYSSSLPTASTLKAAAALAEETKKELSKSEKKVVEKSSDPVSWYSRGTCTLSMELKCRDDDEEEEFGISSSEIPTFTPRVFTTRYDGVLKHKGIQTDDEQKPKIFPSSIPRPTLSLNYYSSTYGSALGRFGSNSTKNDNANQQPNDNDGIESMSSTKTTGSSLKLKENVVTDSTTARQKDEKSSSSCKIDGINSSNSTIANSKLSSSSSTLNNNNGHNKTPGSMTSSGDQSSRSSQQTINNENAVETDAICNNEHETETSTQGKTITGNTKTTTNPTNENSNDSSKNSVTASSTGLVINVANKEFRKSPLNLGLNSKDAENEFAKKQGDLRLQKSPSKSSTVVANDNTTANNNDKTSNNLNNDNTASPLLGNPKRDIPRRPPTDPNKSSQTFSKTSVRKNSQDGSSPSSPTNPNANSIISGLIKMKSSKNISEMRKLSVSSTGSEKSESESSSSLSVTSIGSGNKSAAKGTESIIKKVKKISLTSPVNSESKSQGRRGSATSCSSAASSRSNSVERNSLNNNSTRNNPAIKSNNSNSSTVTNINAFNSPNLPSPNKPPSGLLSSSKETTKKELPVGSITTTGKTEVRQSKLKKKINPKVEKVDVPEPQPVTVVPLKNPNDDMKQTASIVTQKQSTESDEPLQTSYLLRTLGNEKPWLRKCQSGELPWWLTSNPDVPSILGRNPSKTNISRNPTCQDITEQEELIKGKHESSPEFSEESDLEDVGINETFSQTHQLGERTSPDGVEVPSEISPQSTLQSHKADLSQICYGSESRRNSSGLFICNMTNIDEILGTGSPSPAPTPTPTPTNQMSSDINLENQKSINVKCNSDEESDSSESSTSSVVEDELDRNQNESDLDESSDDDDDASTGTSSSFEEVDPSSLAGIKISASAQKLLAVLSSSTVNEGPKERNVDEERRGSRDNAKSNDNDMISKSHREQLDDVALQLYKDGECGTYLDLESSIGEQQEDFEGFLDNRKNSIVLRAQLPVRVHAIIEKLLTADGRELRRALFSLKQIFQEDKDLVHEFVENGWGLNCLIKVGSDGDQNYQNYILRAIGQVMLYVDGMYGVMRHNETIQWLYNMVNSKFRLVQKTSLKLLLVFVDYVETNCLLLVQAVTAVDHNKGLEAWSNIMNLLREQDSGDTELLVYAMSLVNKVLNAIPDIDTYYDQVDALEEQGMSAIIQSYMGKQCADLDLLKQFQIYDLVVKHEDGDEENIMMQLDEVMRSKLLNRKGHNGVDGSNKDRRKSRRHSTSTPPTTPNGSTVPAFRRRLSSTDVSPFSSLSSSGSNGTPVIPNGHTKEKANTLELTPGLRRRRERAEHQKNLILEQLVNGGSNGDSNHNPESPTSLEQENNMKNSPNNGSPAARPWMLPIYTKSNGITNSSGNIVNGTPNGDLENGECSESERIQQLKRENTVKDLTQKLASQNLLGSPAEENKSLIISGELSGVVSKAKEGLAKSKSRADMKPPQDNSNKAIQVEVKKSDNELHWDFLVNNLQRPLEICDLDFTDLKSTDDEDILAPDPSQMNGFGIPPPLPTMNGHPPPPPPTSVGKYGGAPPPPINGFGIGSPLFGVSLKTANNVNGITTESSKNNDTISKKTKKTVKLFWKEVRDDPITASKVEKVGCIWAEIQPTPIDTQRLENLFESRAKDIINKKQSDANKSKEIVVLDPKRSNAINIGMTKLPPPRTIKAAIMKMDSTIINREGIEKLLAMLPTEEERAKITEAQFASPEIPLGSAEQFLLTLSSISELTARLKLWAFKLDYENLEKEVAEPLMDLKAGITALEKNNTFRYILATLLSIGNFLNGADAKGFQIEYLSKVPEVKDTVQKHSLLHHLCQTVNENYPESTDLYSEIGPVTRASRVDFDEIGTNLTKMEADCKISWDHLRVIAKHDGPTNLKLKLSEFLADCAERIIVLGMIHRRIMNRFKKFLLWLGVSAHQVTTTKPHTLFKIISEFALEYRTTRERVIQQLQKKASHRERNKTRGKMITEQIMYKSKEDKEDAELRQVLSKTTTADGGSDEIVRGSLTWRRQKSQPTTNTSNTLYHNFQNSKLSTLNGKGTLNDGDDEILESLVKTATRTPEARERKRNNNGVRNLAGKSLRRTLRHGLTEEERKMLSAFMENGHSFY